MKKFRYDDYIKDTENFSIEKLHISGEEPQHTHEFAELVYIVSGTGIERINGEEYSVKNGDLLFINYNSTHSFSSADTMKYVNVLMTPAFMSDELLNSENILDIFTISLFDEFDSGINYEKPVVSFTLKEQVEIKDVIDYIIAEFEAKKQGYMSVISGYMRVIFTKLLRKIKEGASKETEHCLNSIMPEIMDYIDENCCHKLTLGELAQRSFYNSSYFSRMFKSYSGKNIKEYIKEKRIMRATQLLIDTRHTIEEVAQMVGYSDKKQFYTLFKEVTGFTPADYRKKHH